MEVFISLMILDYVKLISNVNQCIEHPCTEVPSYTVSGWVQALVSWPVGTELVFFNGIQTPSRSHSKIFSYLLKHLPDHFNYPSLSTKISFSPSRAPNPDST